MTVQATAPDRVRRRAARGGSSGRPRGWTRNGDWTWLVAVGSLVFFGTAQYCQRLHVDSYFDLYAGRYVAEHGIPERNVVTALAHGRPWIDQQWLAQLVFYRVWQLGGYAGVTLLSVALVSAGAAVLGAVMLRRGASPLRMCAWTLAALAVSYGYATPRAQSFGYLFTPLVLWLVLADHNRSRPRPVTFLSLPVLVLWANMHGSVLLGAGLVGLHAAWGGWRALRHRDGRGLAGYGLIGLSAVGSVLCTPYGVQIAHYYGSLIGNTELAAAGTEWTPPDPASADSWAFFTVAIAVAIALAVGWRLGVRPQPEVAIFAVVTLGVALMAFRNTPWFGFSGCLLAADMTRRQSAPIAVAAFFRRAIAAGIATCAVVAGISLARAPARQYEAWIPGRAIDVATRIADRTPRLPLLTDQWSAVGLLWLHPELLGRVAFDIRAEQYNPAQLAGMLDFMLAKGPHWRRMLGGYDLIVVSRRWHPRLAGELSRMPGWRVDYSNSSGVVLARAR